MWEYISSVYGAGNMSSCSTWFIISYGVCDLHAVIVSAWESDKQTMIV